MSEGFTVEQTYISVGEWADEFFDHTCLIDNADGEGVEIIIAPDAVVARGGEEVTILWAGALDFEGSIPDALVQYPDLKEWLE